MIAIILTWILFFSLFFLIVTSAILIRNRFELTSILDESGIISEPKISVCIPARNEENHIGYLLESLIQQEYSDYEVHILDDQSTDRTAEIVQTFVERYPEKIQLQSGADKPDDWLGKPWACHQLGERAAGRYLLFLDADTTTKPGLLRSIAAGFENRQVQMVTVWPKQQLNTFWEKSVIPLVYYALVTLLPSIYVYRDPRWMPNRLRHYFKSAFAAACGQCIAIEKDAYKKIGGHFSVKNEIVEDVELAKRIKINGYRMRMFHGVGAISCRMYQNEKELFDGFRKNFFPGFNHSVLLFISAAILHAIVFLLPFLTLFYSLITLNTVLFFLSVACICIVLLHRLILSIWFQWDPIYSLTHPIAVCWFQRLGIVSLIDHRRGRKTEWKGRKV